VFFFRGSDPVKPETRDRLRLVLWLYVAWAALGVLMLFVGWVEGWWR
jgi:hypothetical protein